MINDFSLNQHKNLNLIILNHFDYESFRRISIT